MNRELRGKMFVYDGERDLKAYSNGLRSDVKIVFVGGLGSSLPIDSFTMSISRYCSRNNYEFIIPQLRSQPNFGLFTIDDDVEDLHRLLKSMDGCVVLVGNSTGCQDILHYLKRAGKGNVKLAVLQGAVSDVEYEEHINNLLGEMIDEVRSMDSQAVFYYRDGYITAKRFLDLFSRRAKEDMFSSYLEDNFFKSLNSTGIDILFVISGKDEYAIKNIEAKLGLVENSRIKIIPNGKHVLLDEDDIELFLQFVDEEIKRVFA